jgi:hypothetical protein
MQSARQRLSMLRTRLRDVAQTHVVEGFDVRPGT